MKSVSWKFLRLHEMKMVHPKLKFLFAKWNQFCFCKMVQKMKFFSRNRRNTKFKNTKFCPTKKIRLSRNEMAFTKRNWKNETVFAKWNRLPRNWVRTKPNSWKKPSFSKMKMRNRNLKSISRNEIAFHEIWNRISRNHCSRNRCTQSEFDFAKWKPFHETEISKILQKTEKMNFLTSKSRKLKCVNAKFKFRNRKPRKLNLWKWHPAISRKITSRNCLFWKKNAFHEIEKWRSRNFCAFVKK